MSFLEIPELLVAVLSHLNGPALRSCSLVCRMWREPATELLWAQVEDLDVLVNQSFSRETLQHFKPFPLTKLLAQSFSELSTVHSNPNQDQHEEEDGDYLPEPSPFDEALKVFKRLPIDWLAETELFVKRTRHVSHLTHFANKWSGSYGLLVLHLLQGHQPTALRGVFPRLRALTIAGTRVPPIVRTLTTMPSLRHITFETTNLGGGIHDWIMACQDAPHLISFAIKYNDPKDSGSHQNSDLFDSVRFNEPSALLTTFIYSRPWKHITIPGNLVGPRVLPALGSLDSLETLTINGSLKSYRWTRESARCVFKSMHTLRLIGAANANIYFERVELPNVRHLELDYNPESKTMERDCPIAFFTAMVQACPNASSVAYTVRTKALGDEEFVEDFPESMFEHLLTHGSLQRLTVRIPPTCSIRLSDEFLGRAARAWPRLQELDIDQKHSSRTKVTLQGLAPFARYCAELRSLQLGIEPNHVHTVFNAGLYTQEHEWGTGDRCGLTYLNVGCPAVFSATAVSTFFSVLFPKLIRIEHPESPDSDFYSRGDYFVWSQVVQAVRERDVDLDNLARMLRTQDLAAKHGSCDGDPVQSSIDDSDEDYWAYSGSEDENYSSDEDE